MFKIDKIMKFNSLRASIMWQRWMRKPCIPAEIPSKKCARKVVRASVEHARSNDPFVVLCQDLNFLRL